MKFELWHSENECSYAYFPRDEFRHQRLKTLEPDAELVWEYEAKSYFDAMQACNDYLGYGVWKQEPDWEDTVFD